MTDPAAPMLDLVGRLPEQLRSSWAETRARQLDLPGAVARVTVCGMGGSAAAADLVAGVLDSAGPEIEIRRGYTLPGGAMENRLLVFSSYSGNTEETLSTFDEARRVADPRWMIAITSGGRLADEARAAGVDVLSLPTGLPPRASLGHGVGYLCAVLAATGHEGLTEQVDAAADRLESGARRWGLAGRPAEDETLSELAGTLAHRMPLIYSGAPLTHAVGRRLRAQLNENAKMLASTAELPELDHNEIVGWSASTRVRSDCLVLALRDESEHRRIARRFDLTRGIVAEQVGGWHQLWSQPGPPLARALELVQAGDVLSVLLAVRHGVDPVPVDPILRLKSALEREAD